MGFVRFLDSTIYIQHPVQCYCFIIIHANIYLLSNYISVYVYMHVMCVCMCVCLHCNISEMIKRIKGQIKGQKNVCELHTVSHCSNSSFLLQYLPPHCAGKYGVLSPFDSSLKKESPT